MPKVNYRLSWQISKKYLYQPKMKKHKVLGLMSGTSLDGLDLAYCHFWKTENQWHFDIPKTKSVSYSSDFKSKLKSAIELSESDLEEFHNSYGTWLGEQSKLFIDEHNLDVDFTASHGHTVHHRPEKGITVQIGNGQYLADTSGCKTICDFRSKDVALGGQGAPLVPIGDMLLFSDYDFCLNLGGISNVSYQKENKRIAYDIGIANMALNYVCQKIDLDYDKDGNLARKGILNPKMLQELNKLSFYKLPYPKSTGFEWFSSEIIPIIENTKDRIENLLHTLVYHITEQIAHSLKSEVRKKNASLLVTGGGALNTFLMETLQEKLGTSIKIKKASTTIIEFKEALIFAFMGVLRIEEEINVLASVTGAQRDSCSGVVFKPN